MRQTPQRLQYNEMPPDDSGEFEMYSVKFIQSVISRHLQDKYERYKDRSDRPGINALNLQLLEPLPGLAEKEKSDSDEVI